MQNRDSLRDLLSSVYSCLELDPISFSAIGAPRRALVVRSAAPDIFEALVQGLRRVSPGCELFVLSHPWGLEAVRRACGDNFEIITVDSKDNFSLERLGPQLERLSTLGLDAGVVLYNNRRGMGYENIEQILLALSLPRVLSFNAHFELMAIEDLRLHMTSLKLYQQICDWRWERAGERARGLR